MSAKHDELDSRELYIVSGYIREYEKILKSSSYALFQNIPPGISTLCALYYHIRDYFEYVPIKATISKDKRTVNIKNDENGLNSSYGSWLISSTIPCIYKWYLHFSQTISSENSCIVGIASRPFLTNIAFDDITDKDHKCYRLAPYHHAKWSHEYGEGGSQWVSGLPNCDKNLVFELDLKTKEFSVNIDEQNILVFENIETGNEIEYRVALSLRAQDFSVTINKFTQTF